MEPVVNKQLVFDHFASRNTLLQRNLIEKWLEADPTHRELYYQWLDEWESQHLQLKVDTQAAWQRTQTQLAENSLGSGAIIPVENRRGRFTINLRWLAVAATVVLVLSGGFYVFSDTIFYQTLQTTYGQTRWLTLPDGSHVALNANSRLRIPRFGFGDRTREVYLDGEASFSVIHQKDNQKFVVKTAKDFEVVVLGTEFTVFSRPRETKVVLSRGKVQVNYLSNQKPAQTLMKIGDLVRLQEDGHLQVSHTAAPENYSAWKNHRFVFEKTSLEEIAFLMEETYGIRMEFSDPALAARTVSGTFQAHNADDLLKVISELLEVNYNQQNNKVTFFE